MVDVGGPELLDDPVAVALLQSRELAHLAYVWRDGSPRVVPLWFQHAGGEIVMATMARSPKVGVLADGDQVCVSIDSTEFPYRALGVRGPARVTATSEVPAEYVAAARRYLGDEQGRAWLEGLPAGTPMCRIAVQPVRVSVLDFQTRFPSALS
jgi:hypothetical protein